MQAFDWICSKRAGSSDVFAVHEQVVRGRAMVSKALQAVRVLGPSPLALVRVSAHNQSRMAGATPRQVSSGGPDAGRRRDRLA